MNWKTFVETSQAKQFVLPEGWDSREAIAEQLGCSPENVRRLLAPALKSASAECKQFPVWDRITKRVRAVTAYRRVDPKKT